MLLEPFSFGRFWLVRTVEALSHDLEPHLPHHLLFSILIQQLFPLLRSERLFDLLLHLLMIWVFAMFLVILVCSYTFDPSHHILCQIVFLHLFPPVPIVTHCPQRQLNLLLFELSILTQSIQTD